MSKKTRRTRRIRSMLLIVSMMLVVVMASVGVTVAWLTDTSDAITNTFITSDININLTESSNLHFKMVPGSTITKDPKVTVTAGSEACYLFVQLTKTGSFDDFMTYNMANGWEPLADNDGVYYRTVDAVAADAETAPSFSVFANDVVTVKPTVTKAMMDALDAEDTVQPTLTVQAFACQQANVADAAAAWRNIHPSSEDQPSDTPADDNA